jgi:hypothetical protein
MNKFAIIENSDALHLSIRQKTQIKKCSSVAVISYRTTPCIEKFKNLEFPVVWEAIPAVNRPSFCWFERNFGLNTAVRTYNLVHFSGAAVAASETTATTTVAVSAATAAAVSSPEGASSVIKTHFYFTSAFSGYTCS